MPSLSSTRLYIRGLRSDITELELSKYLSCHGKLSEVKICANYAFVQFEFAKDASLVLETYKHRPLLGKKIVIEFAHAARKDILSMSSMGGYDSPKLRSSQEKRAAGRHPVLILGIPEDVRWQELKDFGRLSGRMVAYCDLDKTHHGRGFIEYFTREDAQHAVRTLNGERLASKRVQVVDYAVNLVPQSSKRLRSRSRSPERQLKRTRASINSYSSEEDIYFQTPNGPLGHDGGSHINYVQNSNIRKSVPSPAGNELRWTQSSCSRNLRDQNQPHYVDSEPLNQVTRISHWAMAHQNKYFDYRYYHAAQAGYGSANDKVFPGYEWNSRASRNQEWNHLDDPYLL